MKMNDKFNLEQYDEAYKFICNNPNTTIIDLGNKTYQIVELPKQPEPTIEEQNETIRQARQIAYTNTSDILFMEYQEAVARGEADADAKRIAWLESKDKIRKENPYIGEVDAMNNQPKK